jgi:hypothetical protein
MQAKDIKPVMLVDKSYVLEKRFNQLLEVVQRQEQEIISLTEQVRVLTKATLHHPGTSCSCDSCSGRTGPYRPTPTQGTTTAE